MIARRRSAPTSPATRTTPRGSPLPSAKRYATDASGATPPSWNVMASQVEPQIAVGMRKSTRSERGIARDVSRVHPRARTRRAHAVAQALDLGVELATEGGVARALSREVHLHVERRRRPPWHWPSPPPGRETAAAARSSRTGASPAACRPRAGSRSPRESRSGGGPTPRDRRARGAAPAPPLLPPARCPRAAATWRRRSSRARSRDRSRNASKARAFCAGVTEVSVIIRTSWRSVDSCSGA